MKTTTTLNRITVNVHRCKRELIPLAAIIYFDLIEILFELVDI